MARFPRSPLTGRRVARKHAIGGTEQRGQTNVDEIDASNAEHHVAVGHHTFVEQTIQEIENRRLGWFEDLVCHGRCFLFAVGASRHQISP